MVRARDNERVLACKGSDAALEKLAQRDGDLEALEGYVHGTHPERS